MFSHAEEKRKLKADCVERKIMSIQLKVIFTYSGGVLQSMM